MTEKIFNVVGESPADMISRLKDNGVRVLSRSGNTIVVEGDPLPGLSPDNKLRLKPVVSPALGALPADVADSDLNLLAIQLRHTDSFRRTKLRRATEDQNWDGILGDCE